MNEDKKRCDSVSAESHLSTESITNEFSTQSKRKTTDRDSLAASPVDGNNPMCPMDTTHNRSIAAMSEFDNESSNGQVGEDVQQTPNEEFPAVTDEETLPMLDRGLIIECLREVEVGDGKLFSHLYQNRLVYDHSEKKWFHWQGHYWQRDDKALVMKIMSTNLAAQYRSCAADILKSMKPGNDDETKRLTGLHKELT
ncbi:MAG: hypothetical protein WAU31_04650, partial [Candidatus Moraniibacteriota bacterium]